MVSLADVHVVSRVGGLARVERVGVVANGVEERTRPATRAVRRRDSRDEPDRIVARRCRGDDVHACDGAMQDVPAAGEQRGVALRSSRARPPERVGVGLVPDHDVSDLVVPDEHVANEAAVVLARSRRRRRSVRPSVDAEDDAGAESLRRENAPQLVVVPCGQVPAPRPPRERHAHGVEPERPDGREDRLRLRPPLDLVVVHADEEPRSRPRAAHGREQQDEERERDRRRDSHVRDRRSEVPASPRVEERELVQLNGYCGDYPFSVIGAAARRRSARTRSAPRAPARARPRDAGRRPR